MPIDTSEWELVNDDEWEPVQAPTSARDSYPRDVTLADIPKFYQNTDLMKAAAFNGAGPYEAGTEFTQALGQVPGQASRAIGTALHETGQFFGDMTKAAAFQVLGETELAAEQMTHKPFGGERPPEEDFVAPWTQGKDQMAFLPRALSSGVEGLITTAPQMGIAAVNPVLGALSFGFTPEGFEPLPAALGLAAPFAGKVGGAVAEKIAQRLGVQSESVLRAAGMAGGSATAAATMTSPEIAHVLQMPEGPDQDKAIADLAGNAGVMGILGLHGAKTNERPTNARNFQEATAVHGDVRQQPVQGRRQMPTEEGGAGVRRDAQAKADQARETPLKETELQEMHQLDQMKQSGRLSLEDSRRLEQLQDMHDSGMSAIERGLIDEAKAEVGHDVEVRRALDDSEPFSGQIATIDRARGKIVINPQEFSLWLKEIPEGQRKQAVRSLMAEESIHLATPDAEANTYWNSITAAEKAIARRRYTGNWSGKALTGVELSDTNFGHEALRARMQQLAGMDPTEIASAVGAEKWTLKGLTAIENSIAAIRRTLGTKASKEQTDVLDRIQKNLGIAKSAVAGTAPGAIRRKESESDALREFEAGFIKGPEEGFKMSNADTQKAGLGIKSVADLDALLEMRRGAVEERNALKAEAQKLMAAGDQAGAMKALNKMAAIAPKSQYIREAIETATNLGSWKEGDRTKIGERPLDVEKNAEVAEWLNQHGDEVGVHSGVTAPAAIRRGGLSKKGQEVAEAKRKIAEMFAKSHGEELPPELQTKGGPATGSVAEAVPAAERIGATDAGALPRISGKELESKAKNVLAGAIDLPSEIRPSFDEFSTWAKRNMEGVKPEQLRDMWEDQVWSSLLTAEPQRLESWRKALGMEANYGTRPIVAKAPPEGFQLGVQGDKILARHDKLSAESKQRYRNKIIGAVARRLIGESIEGRQSLERNAVNIEDVAFSNEKTEFGPYAEISKDMLTQNSEGRFDKLEAVLRDQARASSSDPQSASRRALAVVDAQGRVHLLSTYNDGGTQRVVDPTGGGTKIKPYRELTKSFVNQYRPIASVLLTDPIKGLRQRFETVSEFNDKIGKEASERARIGEWEAVPEGEADPDWNVDEPLSGQGGEGIQGEGGSFMGPGKQSVAESSSRRSFLEAEGHVSTKEAEALITSIRSKFESGEPTSADDIVAAIGDISDRAKSKSLTSQDRLGLMALNKMFKTVQAQDPSRSVEENIQAIAENIHFATSEVEGKAAQAAKLISDFGGPEAQATPSEIRGRRNLPTQLQTPRGEMPRQQFGKATPVQMTPEIGPKQPAPTREQVFGKEKGDVVTRASQSEDYRPYGEMSPQQTKEHNLEIAYTQDLVRRAKLYQQRNASKGRDVSWRAAAKAVGLNPEVGPGSIRRTIKKLRTGRALSNLILKTGSAYDEWMVDRIERSGGLVAEQIAPVFRGIIDREKQLYGELTPALDKARALAGGTSQAPIIGQVPNAQALRATTWLHGMQKVKGAPFAAISNTVGAIENTKLVPPYAQKLVDAAKQANLESGIMMQGVIKGFQASGKFARNITAPAYDAIREGRGELWDKWTAGIAKANGKKISEVRQFFRDFKATLDEPGVNVNDIERVNQDFTRVFPKAVTHIFHNGQWQPMLHADLFNYLENTARRATHIRAFREKIPNNPQGAKILKSINEGLRTEMGTDGQEALDALLRTMQGVPTDNYSSWGALSPTEPAGQLFRFANATVGNVMAKLALTGQMFVQPGELATGATPMFLGYKNYLRGMAQLKQLYPHLEQQGMVNRVMYDFTFDPNSAVRSAFRMAGNTISKAFGEQALNELQEGLAAATAKVTADRISQKTLSPWEVRMLPETFKAMGFNHDEVAGLMQGDKELLGQFQRKAAAFLTSGNRAISEGSKIGANRLFNSIFRFQSYPMMKANQFRKVASRFTEAWGEGTPQEKRAATEQMARFIGGATAQGVLTAGITALAYSGAQGLKVKAHEASDEPVDFLTDMFMSTVSGPLYVAWRGARNKGLTGVGENMTRMIFPFAVANELSDFSTGAGKYHDRDLFGRIGKFLDSKTPGTRAIGTGMALFGLSKDDKPLDAAIDGFYRWRREELGFTERESWLKNDTRKAFRGHMLKALDALRDGDQEKFLEAYADAAGELAEQGSKEKVGESLRRATVLRNATGGKLTPEEMDSLRARIGEDAVDRLEWFDLMIDRAADGDLLPRYDD